MANYLWDLVFGREKEKAQEAQTAADISNASAKFKADVDAANDAARLKLITDEALRLAAGRGAQSRTDVGLDLGNVLSLIAQHGSDPNFGATLFGANTALNRATATGAQGELDRLASFNKFASQLGTAQGAESLAGAMAGGARNKFNEKLFEGRNAPNLAYDLGKALTSSESEQARAAMSEALGTQETAPSTTARRITENTEANATAQAAGPADRAGFMSNLLGNLLKGARASNALSNLGTINATDTAELGSALNRSKIANAFTQAASEIPPTPRDATMLGAKLGGLDPLQQGTMLGGYAFTGPSEVPVTLPRIVDGKTIGSETVLARSPGNVQYAPDNKIHAQDYQKAGITSPGAAQGAQVPAVSNPALVPIPPVAPKGLDPIVVPQLQKPDKSLTGRLKKIGLEQLKTRINKASGNKAFIEQIELRASETPDMPAKEVLARIKVTLQDPVQVNVITELEKLSENDLNILLNR